MMAVTDGGGLMVGDGAVDLLRLTASGSPELGSSVRLRVLGRQRPGATPYNDYLDAELTVTSSFANGCIELHLSPEDMDNWSTALNELAAYRDIEWKTSSSCGIQIELDRSFSVPVPIVTVTDGNESISIRLWLDAGHDWIDALREQFRQVRLTWPNEVVAKPRSRSYWD
ncbi:DUF5959 family protein [Streptomyces sp. NPDC051561]|uniref:DUF5959 family protein n=1 Tax=Streptomyces sp. NPDC051561 TaxID=3365658 RepID=UPI0037A94AA3